MANPEIDNYCFIPLTEQQIQYIKNKLDDAYPPDDLIPIIEFKYFLDKLKDTK